MVSVVSNHCTQSLKLYLIKLINLETKISISTLSTERYKIAHS